MVVKLASVSLYCANAYSDVWGLLQKLSFVLTTAWLFAVHFAFRPSSVGDSKKGAGGGAGMDRQVNPVAR